jgi:hypothetical protein
MIRAEKNKFEDDPPAVLGLVERSHAQAGWQGELLWRDGCAEPARSEG